MHDENSSLKNDVLSLRSENNALSAKVSELRNEVKVIEKSLADAEIQAKTYSEKVWYTHRKRIIYIMFKRNYYTDL